MKQEENYNIFEKRENREGRDLHIATNGARGKKKKVKTRKL